MMKKRYRALLDTRVDNECFRARQILNQILQNYEESGESDLEIGMLENAQCKKMSANNSTSSEIMIDLFQSAW